MACADGVLMVSTCLGAHLRCVYMCTGIVIRTWHGVWCVVCGVWCVVWCVWCVWCVSCSFCDSRTLSSLLHVFVNEMCMACADRVNVFGCAYAVRVHVHEHRDTDLCMVSVYCHVPSVLEYASSVVWL